MDVQKDHVLHSRNGKFEPNTSALADVTRILGAAQAAAPANGLVIHFHGGLVNQNTGRGIADFLAPQYAEAGAYPLFFVWESGLIESLKNNLSDVLADPAFRELVKKISEWSLKKLGGQIGFKGGPGQAINETALRKEFDIWFNGGAPEPPVTDEGTVAPTMGMKSAAGLDEDDLAAEIEAGLDGDPDFQDAIQQLHNTIAAGTAATKGVGTSATAGVVLVDDRALKEMFPGTTQKTRGVLAWISVAKFVAKVVIKVIGRYAHGRAHGMYCTVVEEVLRAAYLEKAGATVWNQMKKDTVDSFGSESQCCGTAVVKELDRLQKSHHPFEKITLVGHSTGAVYICNFLDAMAASATEWKVDIIFLAPAVRHERFATALASHRGRIGGFRLFGMSDKLESDDVLIPILYTRSLLYFVSGVLEGHVDGETWEDDIDAPVVGMARYLADKSTFDDDEFPEVATVRKFLDTIQNAAVWSESTAGNGVNTLSHKHGDFDNDESTVNSLTWIVEHGF